MAELLDSEQGQEAQMMILASDCLAYVEAVKDAGLTDERAIIYAGIWCPTSHSVVSRFIENRIDSLALNDVAVLAATFAEDYATAADCAEYQEGYENRAWKTYIYVVGLDLSGYGIRAYGEGEDE